MNTITKRKYERKSRIRHNKHTYTITSLNREVVLSIGHNENLNRATFWNPMGATMPHAIQLFLEWIDAYKRRSKWGNIFEPHVKFHHIPFEMQFGIVAEFLAGLPDDDGADIIANIDTHDRAEMLEAIIDGFAWVEFKVAYYEPDVEQDYVNLPFWKRNPIQL